MGGLLYRQFYGNVSQNVLKQLYLSLVRPHLEHGCHVWNPHLEKDKKTLEDVQSLACRITTIDTHWDESYDSPLKLLNLQPLQECKIHTRLGLMCRILYISWKALSNGCHYSLDWTTGLTSFY